MKKSPLLIFTFLFSYVFLSNAFAYVGDNCNGRKILKSFYLPTTSQTETIVIDTQGSFSTGAVLSGFNLWDVNEVDPNQLKLLGAGVQSQKTREVTTFACIGAPLILNNSEPECDCIRAIYFNPDTMKAYAFGVPYRIYNINSNPSFVPSARELKRFFKLIGLNVQTDGHTTYRSQRFSNLFKNIAPLSTKDGWNWALNPDSINDKKWLKITSELSGGGVLAPNFSVQHKLNKKWDKDNFDYRTLLNPYMVRLVPNQTGHWLEY